MKDKKVLFVAHVDGHIQAFHIPYLKLFKEDKSIRAILDYYPIVTNSFDAINPEDVQDDVRVLYDALLDNIDDIIKEYV